MVRTIKMAKKTRKNSKPQLDFEVGDLVAAKVKGHPTWPGFVEEVHPLAKDRKKYVVRFFFTKDKCSSFVELKPFDTMTTSERKCNRRGFAEAMQLCLQKVNSPRKKGRIKIATTNNQEKEPAAKEDRLPREPPLEDDVIEENDTKTQSSPTVQDDHLDLSSPTTSETTSSAEDKANQDEARLGSTAKRRDDIRRGKVKEARAMLGNVEANPLVEKEEENNNTENKEYDDKPDCQMDCLPELSSPDDDEVPQPKAESKVEESSKHCSLNDLTSEQANADRGNEPPSNKTSTTQVTKREITLAKLKKKIDIKLREKEEKKAAFRQQKSFEKASKGLPTLIRKFQPLSISSARLTDDLYNEKAANQVRTSMKECEKYLNSLAKCLKLMTSLYGQQQRECYEFHCSLRKIVETLKGIKSEKSHPMAKDCATFLKKLSSTGEIKTFMNSMEFPLYGDSMTAKKENSIVKRKNPVR